MGNHTWAAKVSRARSIIVSAEKDLGPLSNGQRRDLLADNTRWSMDTIEEIVADLAKERAHAPAAR